ncbi:MAG: phosphonate ABC transporter ATP-binding protein [Thermobacillus sp. ZCTH02-B1]|uniref:phosphonate ABC transporter ATP-binding protein n=1 Tax=Thermobacillus sp. ZCTH02-B1 TaxID=1858795 RepID=UPI000B54F873|nr:ATP-binding cassette domain-containing protein [Thermobacillus sp. ZCTH02-B1]OUM96660.1 MAG: phosphonate ABC transporter ATP-binding protein [Thermobacillus sp. ZCTH02-B1]
MIEAKKLTKRLVDGRTVLSDVDFLVEGGKFTVVAGASGSGKSMLLKCLALREKWTSGQLLLDGEDVFKGGWRMKMRVRREIAYLSEKPELNPNRTALKNALIGTRYQTPLWRRLIGSVRSDDYMGVMDVLEQVGLLDKAHAKVSTLSGGERQRVAITMAIVHGARALLLDEPVTGLDPHTAEKILADLKAMCGRGIAVVAVLSNLEWAEKYADRIVGLKEGRVAFDVSGRRLTGRERAML